MSSQKEELSFSKIVRKIGIPILLEDLRQTYRNIEVKDEQKLLSFEKEFIKQKKFEDIERLIIDNDDLFDKNLYLFKMATLLEKDLESQKLVDFFGAEPQYLTITNAKSKKNLVEFASEYLKNYDIAFYELEKDNIIVHTSQEFFGNEKFLSIKQKIADKKLNEIEDQIGFENILRKLLPTDLIYICRYPNLGNILAFMLIDKKADRQGEKKFKWNEFEKVLKTHIKYMDLNKMLVLSAFGAYRKYGYDFEKFTLDEIKELYEYTNKIEKLLTNKKAKVYSSTYNEIITLKYVRECIKKLQNHFISGKYYSDDELNYFILEITAGERSISSIDENVLKEIVKFSDIEIARILDKKPLELEAFIQKGLITRQNIIEVFELQKNINLEELITAFCSEYISVNGIFYLLVDKKISLENVVELKDKLNSDKQKEFEEISSSKKLIELYLSDSKSEEFKNYLELYKIVRINGKTIEEKNKVSNELIKCSKELLEKEKLDELYNLGVITTDVYISYMGVDGKIKYLDENLKIKYFKDDNIEIYLPQYKKYIIGKFTAPNNKFSYGAATYILDEEVYERSELIQNDKILKGSLVALRKEKPQNVKKIIHKGCLDALHRYFEIDNRNLYNENQIEKIHKLSKKI